MLPRGSMESASLPMFQQPLPAVLFFLLLFSLPFSDSYTYEQDVFAINGLYFALGSPPLPGWAANGGDPCTDSWQGVQCVASNITSIVINAANLGGQLGNTLGNFTSIITLDLSNNNIGGTIPEDLPVTMQRFFLSANQLSGSIPSSLSKLALLTDMSLNGNHLIGKIPDAFPSLSALVNLDISSNNLSGPLPPSMGGLSALTTLHIQNNQISGTLNVLQDLPLQDLNIENNLFSGPVPVKLLNIPNFKKDGNPFNTSIAPTAQPPASAAPQSSSSPSSPGHVPSKEPGDSSRGTNANTPRSRKHSISTVKFIGYILVGVGSAVVVVLMVMLCRSKYKERKLRDDTYTKGQVQRMPQRLKEPKFKEPLVKPENDVEKASKVVSDGMERRGLNLGIQAAPEVVLKKQKDHIIDVGRSDDFVERPPPPPPQAFEFPMEKVILNPIVRAEKKSSPQQGKMDPTNTVKSFSVASLQQYTDSFSEENLLRESRLGKVYLAELPDGELLEVLKIDDAYSKISGDDFLELVVNISELRHPNIVGLVGYCAEFGQRLLAYDYCSKMTLYDELHCVDDLSKKLPWNARLQVALEAAKALEYLHDSCQPPIVHQNFEPSIILLDDKLAVHIFECGLAALSRNSVTQLSGHLRALFHYEAPELHESGSSSDRSDVFSFGVVMLELLTGRKPYESSRPRAEQHLVRWANSQLYDIDALSRMVDPSIQGQCSEKALSRFADIISRCIQQEPEFRPPMSEVVQDLARMVSDATEASK